MIKFDNTMLGAFRSIQGVMPNDYERMVHGFQEQERELARQERNCKDEIILRWIQGARQALADLIEALITARDVLEKERENEEEKKRTAHLTGSAIG